MFCPSCNSNLLINHLIEARNIPLMANKSRILYPVCSVCDYVIQFSDVSDNIRASRKVLLITGTAGAGKTALGQLIESKSDYIFIDGDAIQKRVNYFAKQNPNTNIKVDCQSETINTMMILCALGYDVVVGYIINNNKILAMYSDVLKKYGITPIFRVLIPERNICLERDIARDCWTAGEVWVDKWYEDMRSFLSTCPALCIDTSNETLEETFNKHFMKLL